MSSSALHTFFSDLLSPFSMVLSFASLESEIDTSSLNFFLAQNGRLALPKVEGNGLRYFLVTHPAQQLASGSKGIKEPLPSLCPLLKPEDIDAVIVPGLVFDMFHHRLGYGKGHYDRLLSTLPHASSYGVGFKEQLIDKLPSSSFDIPLNHIYLF